MKLFKNYISLAHPEAMFLCSSINEDNTEGNIAEMGEKLATEIINFITENCPENTLGRYLKYIKFKAFICRTFPRRAYHSCMFTSIREILRKNVYLHKSFNSLVRVYV